MAEETKVTLIQNTAGQTVAVRVNDREAIPVLHAGPLIGPGPMTFTLTIADVDLAYEMAGAAPAPAGLNA